MSSDFDDGHIAVDNVNSALGYLETLKTTRIIKLPDKGVRVDECIAFLHKFASTIGLSPDDIIRLANIIKTKTNALASTRTVQLIYCLVPAVNVPEIVVVHFISWINTNTVLRRIKKLLFEWLVAVHCFNLESSKDWITKLYDFVFFYLYDVDVSESAAHLLYIITRKNNVTNRRIRQIMKLSKDLDKPPHLTGLMTLYQVFRPEMINICTKIKRVFPKPAKWQVTFQRVRDRNMELDIGPFLTHCSKGVLNGVPPTLMHEIETYKDFEVLMRGVDTEYSVIQICSSHNVRLIFSSTRGNLLKLRFENFLQVVAYDTCLDDKEAQIGMKFLVNLAASLNLLALENIDGIIFLHEYLNIWDGTSNVNLIFSLISTLAINEFPEVREEVLAKVESVFLYGSVDFQCAYLKCLTQLCQNWIMNYLPQLNEIQMIEGKQAILQLQTYVGKLCVFALIQEQLPNPSIMAVALEFYDTILRLILRGHSTILTLPLPILVYGALFSFSTFFVSEIALLMVKYKGAFERMKEQLVNIDPNDVVIINSYISDIAICVWKGDAHIARRDSIVFKEDFLPFDVRISVPNANKCFAIYRHPAFINHSLEFLREQRLFTVDLEDLLSENFTLQNKFFSYLRERPECNGILKFIETFLTLFVEERL